MWGYISEIALQSLGRFAVHGGIQPPNVNPPEPGNLFISVDVPPRDKLWQQDR